MLLYILDTLKLCKKIIFDLSFQKSIPKSFFFPVKKKSMNKNNWISIRMRNLYRQIIDLNKRFQKITLRNFNQHHLKKLLDIQNLING